MKFFFPILNTTVFIGLILIFHAEIPALIYWIQGLGPIAPILFILLYCVSTLLFLPSLPFVLAAGAFFGPIFGSLLSVFGATTSAVCAFLISRHLGTHWLSSRQNTSIYDFIKHIKYQGWKSVALLRLTPTPFSLVNYGFGLTQIKLRLYTLTTFFFLIPYKVIITYFGYVSFF
ncbi:MAG: VTT domain-containing protein [Gammaproteobacteria bacterium]|nr:VTT domain-containing protein [Gammaproteobacteria bacterium]